VSARHHDDTPEPEAEILDAVVVDEREEPQPRDPPHTSAPVVVSDAHAPLPARSLPVARAAAVAVSGFAAGAVVAAVVQGVGKRRAVKAAARKRDARGLPVLGTRSFLVDVHLLGGKD
jgi:hypothetical protein